MTLTIIIPGAAQPAGSKRAVPSRNGKFASVIDANPKASDWKRLVALAAKQQLPAGFSLIRGPIRTLTTFFRVRPASHYGSGKNAGVLKPSAPMWPTPKPDATKLWRGTEDALTGIVWADDAQIVDQRQVKRYAPDGKGASVIIEITELSNLAGLGEYAQPQTATTGVNAFLGKWPGDETDEEILEALREADGKPTQTPISGSAAIQARKVHR